MNKNIFSLLILSFSLLFLVSCGNKRKDDPNYIRVGVQSGPEYVVAQAAQKVAKEKFGLDVELVTFNDYVMPNTALNEGDIDANAYQHKPFLDDQMAQRGYKFSAVGNTFLYPMAGYSKKIKSLSELKDGSKIVIPNDATNGGRALLLLQKEGLIALKDSSSLTPRVVDIIANPKKLEIVELEAPQLSRVLEDNSVVIAIINNTYASQANLMLSDGLFAEDKDSPYVNIIVARDDNKDSDKVRKFVTAYQSDEVAEVAAREFKGGAVKGW